MKRTAHILTGALVHGDACSNHTCDLARLLIASGLDVHIYVEQTTRGGIGLRDKDILSISSTVHTSDYKPTADVCILQYASWYPLAERFRDAKGARVLWYHGVTPPELWRGETERDFLERSLFGTSLVWFAHLAVADSPFSAGELHKTSMYPFERIRVVPLGVDTRSFAATPPDRILARLRTRWNLSDRRVLLYVGRIAGNKRIDLLIEALALLADKYPDLHLLIVGDDRTAAAYREMADALRRQVQDLGLANRVTFTGKVPEIEPYYHLAHLFVLPSQHEGFGVPLIEAAAAGIPVIASASGAMPWVLDALEPGPQPAGLTFIPGDAPDLATKVATLLQDESLRQRMVARGIERAGFFSLEHFNERTMTVVAGAEAMAREGQTLVSAADSGTLISRADIALRNFRVRSYLPLVGPLVERIRVNMTAHVKEAYLDRIVERQVMFNYGMAEEIRSLSAEVEGLKEQIAALHQRLESTRKTPTTTTVDS